MKKAIRYSLVVCLVSWVIALAFYLLTGSKFSPSSGVELSMSDNLLFTAFRAAFMFLPLICALVLQWIDKERLGATGLLKFRFKWSWVVGWLIVPVMVALSIPVNGLFGPLGLVELPEAPGIESPQEFLIITLVSGLFAGVSVNAVAAFGEEYGWRNYMVDALRGVKFWKACLLIGIVWGLWHFPIILMGHNYPQHNVAGVFMMCAMTLALSVIEMYFVLKARSVYPAAIIHGSFNALAGAASLFVPQPNDLLNGMSGFAGFIALYVACMGIWVYDRFVSKDRIFSKTIGESLGE